MTKEWILNIATNRWRLNKKDSVGPVSKNPFTYQQTPEAHRWKE